jgi:hypothetical protein
LCILTYINCFFQYKFEDNNVERRDGTLKDAKDLTATLKSIGFKIKCFQDLCLYEIKREMKKIRKTKKNVACIVIVILSHGDEDGFIHCYDSKYSLRSVIVNELADCKNLAGKAKIVVVQACR